MPSFEELLSDLSKESLAETLLNVRGIYHLRFTEKDGIKPKNPGDTYRDKFFVVVGVDSKQSTIGYLILNSEINLNLGDKFKKLQYKIHQSNYKFLKHDSFLDCSKIREMSMTKFCEVLYADTYGFLSTHDYDAIYGILVYSNAPKLLKRFGLL